MNIYEFASGSPYLAFFIAYMLVSACIEYPLRLVNRWIRHRNIVKCGWPPSHLDADGDWKPKDTTRSDI